MKTLDKLFFRTIDGEEFYVITTTPPNADAVDTFIRSVMSATKSHFYKREIVYLKPYYYQKRMDI